MVQYVGSKKTLINTLNIFIIHFLCYEITENFRIHFGILVSLIHCLKAIAIEKHIQSPKSAYSSSTKKEDFNDFVIMIES